MRAQATERCGSERAPDRLGLEARRAVRVAAVAAAKARSRAVTNVGWGTSTRWAASRGDRRWGLVVV